MLPLIAKEYAPYDTLPAFAEGYAAYRYTYTNPYPDSVAAQAWDRGLACAARVARWTDQHVGCD